MLGFAIMLALGLASCGSGPSAEQQALGRVEIGLEELATDMSVVHSQLDSVSGGLDGATDERADLLATIDELAARLDDLEARQQALLADVVEAEIDRACAALAADEALTPREAVRFDDAWTEVADPAEVRTRAAACAERRMELAQARAAIPERCQVVTNKIGADELATCGQIIAQSTEMDTTGLPVTGTAGEGITTVVDVAIPVLPGDTLDVSGFFQVTNDLGYNIGVGAHVWAMDVDADNAKWFRISPSVGDNVDQARHHMPVELQTIYIVPNKWTSGSVLRVALRADAHSTAGSGDLTVEPSGNLIVRVSRS